MLLSDPDEFLSPDSDMPSEYLYLFDGPVDGAQAESLGSHTLFARSYDLISDIKNLAMKGKVLGLDMVILNRGPLPGRTIRADGVVTRELAKHGDALLMWHWAGDGQIKIELLSLKESTDVSKTAESLGGGGHTEMCRSCDIIRRSAVQSGGA